MLGSRISQAFQDEGGHISSARISAYVAAFGFFLFGALAVVFAIMKNQMGVTACVTLAGVAFGKSAADMMAAQKKSGVVLAAQATATASISMLPTPNGPIPVPSPNPTPAPAPSPKGDPREHDKRVLSIMRLSFVPRTVDVPHIDKPDLTLRPHEQIFIKDGKPYTIPQKESTTDEQGI